MPKRRQAVVKNARTLALKAAGCIDAPDYIELKRCPRRSDVDKLAAALEELYPGYGERLVLLAYATGMRFCELLALRVEAVHFGEDETLIDVDWQLDRYESWPAVTRPKGGKTRQTIIWDVYMHVLASLVEDAQAREGVTHGWLFPPVDGVTSWVENLGDRVADAVEACEWSWSFHWLRHAWASLCLAPAPEGYNLDLASVAVWLGHARNSTTNDMYRSPLANDAATAKKRTARLLD
nr:site-specific integrase [Nocardioides sp. IC4_145]